MLKRLWSSTHDGTHPATMMKELYTYIHPCGNTYYNHDGRALHLHSPMREHILQPWWKGSALTFTHAGTRPATMIKRLCSFTHVGTHPATMMKELCTYIHPYGNTSCNHDGRDLHLHPPMHEHILQLWWKGSALTFTHVGTHPTTMMKGICTYIHPCGNTYCNHDEKALHLHPPMWEHILKPWWKGSQPHVEGSCYLTR